MSSLKNQSSIKIIFITLIGGPLFIFIGIKEETAGAIIAGVIFTIVGIVGLYFLIQEDKDDYYKNKK